MKKTICLFLFSCLFLTLPAANSAQEAPALDTTPPNALNSSVFIQGTAPSYAQQTLQVLAYTNGWTRTNPLLDSCTVALGGEFQFSFPLTETQKIYLPLGRYTGSLFVEPGHSYTIDLPACTPLTPADQLNPYFQPEEILLSLTNLPKQDLNHLIASFEDAFDEGWLQLQQTGISPASISQTIAQLETQCPSLGNDFFDAYKTYRYALLVNLYEKESPNRAVYTFFLDQPVLYHQPSYWEAFEVLFPSFSPISALQSNPELMDAVILQKVVQGDLDLSYLNSIETPENARIAQAILKEKKKLSVGTPLSLGKLVNLQGDTLVWDDLAFQQAYFIFANSHLNQSLADLHYAEQMQAQYKDRCLFVVIFDKEPRSTTQLTCKNSPQQTFIFSTEDNPQIRAIFEEINLPSYYLVDREKRLRQSPAPQPKDFVP